MDENKIKLNRSLYPLACLYRLGVWVRNKMYDWGICRSKSFDIPVISIGNIAVGGTGKTPHTEMIIELLKKDFSIAVLSRGYKRKTSGYVIADDKANANKIGDESYQIYCKYPDITVAVDEDRADGITKLMSMKTPFVEVVVLDDAFQHRKVDVGLNILLTDYNRMYCDDAVLPVGRLREPMKSKSRADIVIVTKCPKDMKPIEYNILSKRLELFPYQKLFFSSIEYEPLAKLSQFESKLYTADLQTKYILLVTAIASETQIMNSLKERSKQVVSLRFSDHHYFSNKDIAKICRAFEKIESDDKIIVVTEKDATKLRDCTIPEEIREKIYVQPIRTIILQNKEEYFNKQIIDYVRKNKRNGRIPKE